MHNRHFFNILKQKNGLLNKNDKIKTNMKKTYLRVFDTKINNMLYMSRE